MWRDGDKRQTLFAPHALAAAAGDERRGIGAGTLHTHAPPHIHGTRVATPPHTEWRGQWDGWDIKRATHALLIHTYAPRALRTRRYCTTAPYLPQHTTLPSPTPPACHAHLPPLPSLRGGRTLVAAVFAASCRPPLRGEQTTGERRYDADCAVVPPVTQ